MEDDRGPIEPELAELVARRSAALAEPTRLRLLDTLRGRDEAAVGELSEALGAGDANVSKHLQILLDQRSVARRREGKRVLYRIDDPGVLLLCEQVCAALELELRDLAERAGAGAPARAPSP